ncbi:hypothetical protein [Pseudolysinimonas sp.]|uniref:hypothetical protein n=1 Tax=Pseudolysinimonas sp. TaxID=2680009 RepID=UPI003F7D99DB
MSDDALEIAPPASRVTTWVTAVVFAVLFAAPLFYAVSNLVEYPAVVGGRTPWWLLILGVIAPVALYVGGLLIGRRRTPVLRLVVLAAALGAANALTIAEIAIAPFLLA